MNRYIDEDRFREMCLTHEVSEKFATYLRLLIDYKVVIIADDSGSMKYTVDGGPKTRWDELCQFVTTVFTITQVVENSPLDVCFLNRASITRVQKLDEIQTVFQSPPKGYTPITRILKEVLKQRYDSSYKGRLILICTDGQPTDDRGNVRIEELRHVLEYERSANDYVTFLACTDDEESINYMNDWDVQIPRVDVVDDYKSERAEVLAAQGSQFRFSYTDYVVKVVMGSIVPELDKLDEKPGYGGSGRTRVGTGENVQCGNCTQQ